MSAANIIKLKKPGRPATGITKARPSLTIDAKLLKRAKKAAFAEGVALSAWIERCVRTELSPVEKGAAK